MKKLILSLFTIASVISAYAQNPNQSIILNKFIAANNAGTHEAFSQFISDTYSPDLLKKVDIKDHIEFYTMISEDFGKLKTVVYEKIEEKPLRLVVHLIKENQSLLNKSINPAEVLVVEMDLDERNQKYLKKGLGMGALICELKK
jgi:hypothetical protein